MRAGWALFVALLWAINPAAAEDKPLKVGIMLELSGNFSSSGNSALHGFQYVLQQHGGKLGGRTVETVIEDNAGDPATAIVKVKKLVESDKVDVLFGPVSSGTGAAVRNYIIEQKIPTMMGSTVAEVLDGKYMFRTSFDGNVDGYLQGYLAGASGHKKAVLLAPNYLAGQSAIQYFEKGFNDAGGTAVQKLMPRIGATDYGSFIGQISPDADCAIVFFPGADAVRFLKQFADYGTKLPLFGFTSTVDETLLPAEGQAAVGFVGASQYFSTITTPENLAFLKDWNAAHKDSPEKASWLTLSGWIAAATLDQAIERVHGDISDTEAFMKSLKQTHLNTPAGPFRFDENQNPVLPRYIVQIRDVKGEAKPVVIGTIPEFVPVMKPPTLPADLVWPKG
jgi:branched-chain amino acid transport system substrate-binding protein